MTHQAGGSEVALATTSESYDRANSAATAIDFDDLRAVAGQAGLDEWLANVDASTIQALGSDVTTALRMPFPSPTAAALRSAAGYNDGVSTEAGTNRWSMCVAPSFDPDQPHDIGVQLVNQKHAPGSRTYSLHVPLDIAVLNIETVESRPDRVMLQIGERQLPGRHIIYGEDAQRLLLVAHRFLHLLSSGEATERLAFAASSRESARALPVGSVLKRLLLGEN
jgi:hypothetical protein